MAFRPCHIPKLTAKQARLAADRARAENPHRWPANITPAYLAVERRSWWGDGGKKFGVAFAKGTSQAMKDRVLAIANGWSEFANVEFVYDSTNPIVRIGFQRGGGHWSYLGTDILGIPSGQPTMNLELSMRDSDEEFGRTGWHEIGHTIGCPHEHMRPELVARIDVRKAERYFKQTQGWDARTVREQVLTSLSEKSLFGTEHSDQDSIMCYMLPGEITVDGQPIRGGNRINANDAAFIGSVYPKPVTTPPTGGGSHFEGYIEVPSPGLAPGTYRITAVEKV